VGAASGHLGQRIESRCLPGVRQRPITWEVAWVGSEAQAEQGGIS
jgi:hypothetical protein